MDRKRQTVERCGRGFAFAVIDNKRVHHILEKHTRGEGKGSKSTVCEGLVWWPLYRHFAAQIIGRYCSAEDSGANQPWKRDPKRG